MNSRNDKKIRESSIELRIISSLIYSDVALGGLGVKCSPRDPMFAGANPAEVDGFIQDVKTLSTILREGL